MANYGKFHSVATANLPESGVPGDVYFDTTRGLLFAVIGDNSLVGLLQGVPIPVKGDPGPTGLTGPVGPQGPAFTYAGNWNPNFEYPSGSIANYNNFLYFLNGPWNFLSLGVTPSSNPFWELLGPSSLIRTASIICVADGSGVVPALGFSGYFQMPWAGTIVGWSLLSDVPGDVTIDVKASSFAALPATSSITGGNGPALVNSQKAEGGVSGWATSFSAGDILEIDLLTCTVNFVTLAINVTEN